MIYDNGEQLTAIKQAFRDLQFDEKMYRPSDARGYLQGQERAGEARDVRGKRYWAEVARHVYTRYQEIMNANGALDFDDLLTRTTWLSRSSRRC